MFRTVSRGLVALLAVAILAACAQEPMAPPDTSAADRMAIDQLRSAWQAAYNGGDGAALAALYSEDAVLMGNEEATVTGRAAIQTYYETAFAEMTGTSTVTSQTMDISGDLGFDSGTFSGTMTPTAGGDAMTREGRYIVILRRSADGAWRISRSISNTAMPADAMMPGGGQ